jgi:phosphomannomutase
MNEPKMNSGAETRLACFKAYDVRGRIGDELNADVVRRIGFSFAQVMQPSSVVVGYDCRETSSEFAKSLAAGLVSAGVEVLDIGQAGTEEIYFATTHLQAGGGIIVTASHNPIEYNGLKFVGAGSRPLTDEEFEALAARSSQEHEYSSKNLGRIRNVKIRKVYAKQLASLVDAEKIGPVRVVVNAGNGVAGPAFDEILYQLTACGAQISAIRMNHDPNGSFPAGIPNPLLKENRPTTAEAVRASGADLGIAWDGDFDRCFFFDENGNFVDGEYVVALLAASFLKSAPGETIVHDPRVVWNTTSQVASLGGRAHVSQTGHAHVKRAMRASGAIYGGEMSAHHYFREFMCCDSGMIPWMKILELMGRTQAKFSDLVGDMVSRFPSSGERNFSVADPIEAMDHVQQIYSKKALDVDLLDGLSLTFSNWRLNLRPSSTEPLLRLNVESRGDKMLVDQRVREIEDIINY